MEKKERQSNWLRIGIFLGMSAGLIYFLSSKVNSAFAEKRGKVKSASTSKVEQVVGEVSKKIEAVIPNDIKEQFQQLEEKVLGESSKVTEQNEVVKQIQEVIQEAAAQLTGFPEKQKKEVKKEIIKEVCEQLLKESD